MSEEQKTQRTITPAEIRRAELLKQREEKLFAEGYVRHDLTTSIEKANTAGLLYPLPFAAVIVILFLVLHGMSGTIVLSSLDNWPVCLCHFRRCASGRSRRHSRCLLGDRNRKSF